MLEKTERILPENIINIKNRSNISESNPKKNIGFFSRVIATLKSNKMDFSICESLFIYRLKFILEKNKKRKTERKSSVFDSNHVIDDDIENIIPKIFKIFEVDGQIIILSLFLLEKVLYKCKILLDELNILKLIIVSLLETIKFNIDEPEIDGNLICSVLKIDKEGLINIEMSYLSFVDYKLKIEEEKFFTYKQKIMIPWIDYLKDNL